jgi:hypothetical protein
MRRSSAIRAKRELPGVDLAHKVCAVPGCGKEALCGIGVSIKDGVRGDWYCFPHYKEKLGSHSLPLFEKSGQTGGRLSPALGSEHHHAPATQGCCETGRGSDEVARVNDGVSRGKDEARQEALL